MGQFILVLGLGAGWEVPGCSTAGEFQGKTGYARLGHSTHLDMQDPNLGLSLGDGLPSSIPLLDHCSH